MHYVLTLAVALFVAMTLIPPLARVAARVQLIDIPNHRKIHRTPIPRVGGIAMIVGTLVPVLLWVPIEPPIAGLLAGIAVLAVFGVWDDRSDLDYRLKFLAQFIAAGIVVLYGGVRIEQLPLIDWRPIPALLSVPMTVIALVAVTNAINLSDGLDGLAGGTTLLTLGCVALLGYAAGDQTVVILCLALMGAVLGFLRYNSYPAQVYMGDAGSQFLGFTAGALAIFLTQQSNPALSAVLPLILLGLPILDTTFVMTQRILDGRSPFKPDRNHIHHRLLSLGLDQYESVMLIYAVQVALTAGAFFLCYERDSLLIGLYATFCGTALAVLVFAGRNRSILARAQTEVRPLARVVLFLAGHRVLQTAPRHVVGLALPVLFISAALLSEDVPSDIGMVALACLAGLVLVMGRGQVGSVMERIAIYGAATFAVFLLQTGPGLFEVHPLCIPAFYGLLAIAIACAVRFAADDRFRTSPLDFLVIVLVVAVSLVSQQIGIDSVFVRIAIKLVIVFYACELLLVGSPRYWATARISALGALLAFAVRGCLL
jgi:UDP-GlcNAc:undecaprenyl-phosphate GlcNAc-1-phosphate transferase